MTVSLPTPPLLPPIAKMPDELLAKVFDLTIEQFQFFRPPTFHEVCRRWRDVEVARIRSSGIVVRIPPVKFEQGRHHAILQHVASISFKRAIRLDSLLHVYIRPYWDEYANEAFLASLAAFLTKDDLNLRIKTLVEQPDTGVWARTISQGIPYPNLEELQIGSLIFPDSFDWQPVGLICPSLKRLFVHKCFRPSDLNVVHCETLTVLVIGFLYITGEDRNHPSANIREFGDALRNFPNLIQVGLSLENHGFLEAAPHVFVTSVRRLGLLYTDPMNYTNCWSSLLDIMPKVEELTIGDTRFVDFFGVRNSPFHHITTLTFEAAWYDQYTYDDTNRTRHKNVARQFLRAFPFLLALKFVKESENVAFYHPPHWDRGASEGQYTGSLMFLEALRTPEPSREYLCPRLARIQLEHWELHNGVMEDLLETLRVRFECGRGSSSILLTTKFCGTFWHSQSYPNVDGATYLDCTHREMCTTRNILWESVSPSGWSHL